MDTVIILIQFMIVGSFGGFLTQVQGKDKEYKLRIPSRTANHIDFGFIGGIINGIGIGLTSFFICQIFEAMQIYGLLFSFIMAASGCSVIELVKRTLGIDLVDSTKKSEGNKKKGLLS